jgi:hypothetical protein
MLLQTTQPRLAPPVRSVLYRLRRRIRRYVWLEGLAIAAAWVGLAFWISLGVDWSFEPPVAVRVALLAGAGLVLAGPVVRFILRRAFVPMSDSNMATVLERRFPQFDDSLLTAVVLSGRSPEEAGFNPQMLAHTCDAATERVGTVELRRVFNPVPLWRSLIAAVGLAAAVAAFAVFAPGAFDIWAKRTLLLDRELLWPRSISLEIDGFPGGVAKVAAGDEKEIIVRAKKGDTEEPVVPDKVEVRYLVKGGSRKRALMTKQGGADEDTKVLQEYSYKFNSVQDSIEFEIVGGDARIRNLRIEVVPPPTLEQIVLLPEYPAYTGKAPTSRIVDGPMPVPMGTRLTVQARANKELERVEITSPEDEHSSRTVSVLEKGIYPFGDDGRSFSFELEPGLKSGERPLMRSTVRRFNLLDTDGIKGREVPALTVTAVPDAPPQLAVQLTGIGSAITPQARIPVVGKVTDDWGIREIWFEYGLEDQDLEEVTVWPQPQNGTDERPAGPPKEPVLARELKKKGQGPDTVAVLDVSELDLAPGKRFLLSMKASDWCDLDPAKRNGNVGTSEQWLLDVVTPDQLRVILEAREFVLRQRFEAIIEEVDATRALLARMDFSPPVAKPSADKKAKPADKAEVKKAAPGAEPGEEPGDSTTERSTRTPAEELALRAVTVQQAVQNTIKNAQETLDIANSFDNIREQFKNNGMYNKQLEVRLGEGIADPLFRVAEGKEKADLRKDPSERDSGANKKRDFPELERRLESLQEAATNPSLDPQERCNAARQKAEEVLADMRRIHILMLQLEDYNKLVDWLREIIQDEEKVESDTKEKRKQGIRDLLEK